MPQFLVFFDVAGKPILMPIFVESQTVGIEPTTNIEEVFDGQKQTGLEGLLAKYSSDFIEQGREYIEKLRERTRVFKMTITDISGKARRE